MLTQERLKELLHYDPETGIFTRLKRANGRNGNVGDVIGSLNGAGYYIMQIDHVIYLAHRLAWLYVTGAWPAHQIDHKNSIRSDNRFENLRDVTPFENMQNQRKAQKQSACQLLGVHFRSGSWTASIKVLGKSRHLGCYRSPELAHEAYLRAKRELHPGNTL